MVKPHDRGCDFSLSSCRDRDSQYAICSRSALRTGLNAHVDWQTRFIKILAFKTAKIAGISELI
jgi:hypothetical protein